MSFTKKRHQRKWRKPPNKGTGRRAWWVLGLVALLAVVFTTQVFAASITVTTQPLQNTGTNNDITYTQDWSATGGGSSSPSFVSTSDSYVDQSKATSNFGTLDLIKLKALTNKASRSLVQFDVSSIPGGSTVSSATLTLCATAVPNQTRTHNVHRVTSSWVETSVNWNTQPTVAASATDSATTPASAGCMTWTVTADVQAWVDGTTNNGLRVSENDETGSGAGFKTSFRSRDDTAVPADVPTLDVTYTGSLTMRQESSDLTLNGSDQVTSVTVGGSKNSHTGTKNITVTLKDGAGATLDSGTATLPTASGTYNVSVTMTGGTTAYFKVATVDVTYING